ncbi:MAG: PaaI family thioesterase [Bacteroidales bacterium]|nr:PaaI family thioesterase [Bacteroidales bacterium]
MNRIINPWREHPGYNCFGCAPHNPRGLHMEFYEEGDDIVSFWRPETYYQGWVDTMHGGILSTLIDETCGWVVTRKKQTSGFTTGLNLRFRRAVSTGDPLLTIRARIASQRRNLLTISASLCNAAGEVCVEGEAVYFLMNEDKAREMGFKPCEVEPSDRQEADAALVSAVPRRMRRSDRQMALTEPPMGKRKQ